MMLKRFLLSAAAITLAASPAVAQRLPATSMLIADVDGVVAQSVAGRGAATALEARVATLRTRADALTTQLQAEANAIRAGQQGGTLKDKPLEDRIVAFEARQKAATEEIQRAEADIQRAQSYVSQQLGAAMRPLIAQLMQEKGASMIVPASAVLQHSAGLDVTPDLLAKLNAALPSVSTTPPPPTAAAPAAAPAPAPAPAPAAPR
ncbi:OmpH family outer membrane protein [Polymorphobacter multimanifer]|nr:OmpH family outer membrane protein [Polymorphobacter multimanifer]